MGEHITTIRPEAHSARLSIINDIYAERTEALAKIEEKTLADFLPEFAFYAGILVEDNVFPTRMMSNQKSFEGNTTRVRPTPLLSLANQIREGLNMSEAVMNDDGTLVFLAMKNGKPHHSMEKAEEATLGDYEAFRGWLMPAIESAYDAAENAVLMRGEGPAVVIDFQSSSRRSL